MWLTTVEILEVFKAEADCASDYSVQYCTPPERGHLSRTGHIGGLVLYASSYGIRKRSCSRALLDVGRRSWESLAHSRSESSVSLEQ
jgi:hypothetical protein